MQALLQRLFTPKGTTPTPVQRVVGVPAAPEMLPADQITPETLLTVFRQAYLEVESLPDSSLMLTLAGDGRVRVRVDAERKLLSFTAVYGLKEEAATLDKLELANRVNDGMVLVRLSVADDTTLVSDHYVRLDGVFTPRQLVEGVRHFAQTTRAAIQCMDTGNVVN